MFENKNRWQFHEVAEALYIDTSQIVAEMDLPDGTTRVIFTDVQGTFGVNLARDEDNIYQLVDAPEYVDIDSERVA